eukprot:COSAG01_NODE_14613_length_1431_cov_1.464366_2_plen_119_part_00
MAEIPLRLWSFHLRLCLQVTHGLTMRLILMHLAGWSPNTFHSIWNAENCSMCHLRGIRLLIESVDGLRSAYVSEIESAHTLRRPRSRYVLQRDLTLVGATPYALSAGEPSAPPRAPLS